MSTPELRTVRRQKMAMVFQSFALLPNRTVIDNIAYGLEVAGQKKARRYETARAALTRVGLGSYEKLLPSELSGGMQQRVGLARALAVNPSVLLMDEAFSALDPLIRFEMQNELLRLQKEEQRTIVFISHDIEEAVKIGGRIGIMKDGRLIQVDTPAELIQSPTNDYVRDFFRNVDVSRFLQASSLMTKVNRGRITCEMGAPSDRYLNDLIDSGVDCGFVCDEAGRFHGRAVGEPIGRHPDIDMVSFTGSTAPGRKFLSYSSESNLKEVVLEMGGKNPCVVMSDVMDLDAVAGHIVNGALWNMGENCSAISRLIVHRDIKVPLLEKITELAAEWRVGDPLDPENRIGPLVSKQRYEKVQSYLSDDINILFGGQTSEGRYVHPTIIDVESNDVKHAREEIFGPILVVITVDSLAEAIEVANDTEYGLAASVFASNGKRALRAARAIRAGTVTVNSFGEGDITIPFGGFKQSGFGGRDNSLHAHDQYTQLKTIWLDLNDNEADEE